MELDELLRIEGLEAADVRDTLAWARQRAEEIVSGLVADAELGPLLDDEFTRAPLPPLAAPADPVPSDAAADPGAPLANGATPPPYDASMSTNAPAPVRRTSTEPTPVAVPQVDLEPGHTERSLPVAPPRPDLREVGPGEPGPMADAAYDQGSVAAPMPEPGATDLPSPSAEREEATQPRAPFPADPSLAPPAPDAIELDDEEIELLDDDDLELLEEEGVPPTAPINVEHAGGGGAEVPEWQAALNSAAMGGGAQADQDSGLYRMPSAPEPDPPVQDEPAAAHDESTDASQDDSS